MLSPPPPGPGSIVQLSAAAVDDDYAHLLTSHCAACCDSNNLAWPSIPSVLLCTGQLATDDGLSGLS